MKLKQFFFLLFLFGCAQAPVRRTDKLSILQGITGPKEVELSVLAPEGRKLRFELRNSEGKIVAPEDMKTVSRQGSPWVVHKMIFIRNEGQDYNFYAFEGEVLIDQRLIGRGPSNTSSLRLAVASCMNDFDVQHAPIWNELFKRNPEYLLLIGDNVYADRTASGKVKEVNPELLWERYVDVRLNLPLYFQEKLVPTHALWDDHDYGIDNGNASFLYKKESKEIFDAFWAQELAEENWSEGHGTGGLLSLGDFNLYFLDSRSFRSPSPEGKHLGAEQEKWLLTTLKERPGPSFLIKGDQFFGGYHGGESFESTHSQNFTEFTAQLSKIDTPFIFVSGDRHLSEIMQFPRGLFKKPSFEITSSPIQSIMTSSPDNPNPWRVVQERNHQNFVIIENQAKENHWFLDVQSIGVDGQVLFKRELAVFIKDLQDNLQEVRKRRRSGERRYRRRIKRRR